MARCLQLAKNGMGSTYPNPMVGCVIVHQGKIIGEGWHKRAGGPHAEVVAIESVSDKSLLKASELYVNLEPCSHHGRTPPCADLIISHSIPKVFIGTVDDNELVGGKGISRLRANGIRVETGILEERCRRLNRRFFTFHNKHRPYVILKWAQSADGFMNPASRERASRAPVWISNAYSRQLTHKWRTQEQAILVGTQTVVDDDPSLTIRDYSGEGILRLVIDREGKLSKKSKVFSPGYQTLVFCDIGQKGKVGSDTFEDNVRRIFVNFEQNLPAQILDHLWRSGIQSLIVEGGARTLEGFIQSDLWDEARIFIGSVDLRKGGRAPVLKGFPKEEHLIGDDKLVRVRNESNDCQQDQEIKS